MRDPLSTVTGPEAKTCTWKTENKPRVITMQCPAIGDPKSISEGEVDKAGQY